MENREAPGAIAQGDQEGGNRVGREGRLDTQDLLYRSLEPIERDLPADVPIA